MELENALYIVPTPIGNIEDITVRALKVLRSVDIIACEDTRHSGILLKLLEIPYKKLISYHEHNEQKRSEELVELIQKGNSIALISDAGTPCISDPGYRLVNFAREKEINVIALPGASASITALSGSGFPTDKFHFLGFPPQKKGRKTFIENLEKYSGTIILYESPYRVIKLLDELLQFFGEELEVSVAREISKIYEEYKIGKIADVKVFFEKKPSIKGEFVFLLNMNAYFKKKS